MQRSTERILTTHVGSLARPHALLNLMNDKANGRPYDQDAYDVVLRGAVADVVARQCERGIDIVTDGELGKVSFVTYVEERLGGLEPRPGTSMMPRSWQKEIAQFPGYYDDYFEKYAKAVAPMTIPVCTGPITYRGHAALTTDIANLRAALARTPAVEAFLSSTSPAIVAKNAYYDSEDEFRAAVAEALREEWLQIVDAGLVLQIDDPWLIELLSDDALDRPQRRRAAHAHVERINHALRGIPPERVRLHTCYGLNHGPRVHDLPLREVARLMVEIDACAYSFEVANPRHMHEWRVWQEIRLDDDKILMPGFIGHATAFVEHPELIADGIATYAGLVGRERVIASTDCGFSSRATYRPELDPSVVWAKLDALVEGARIASERLWHQDRRRGRTSGGSIPISR